jgi:NADH-quinone oxidoreductase subunit M
MNLLDILIAIPAVGFIVALMIPRPMEQAIRLIALVFSLVAFAVSLGLAIGYQTDQAGQQFVTNFVWIANPEIHYHVGIDGLSLWLIILSTFLTPIAILISWKYIHKQSKEFFALLLLLEFGLVGVFCAWDLFLFFVFWEIGSALMLAAIIFLYLRAGTFDYVTILGQLQSGHIALSHMQETFLFLAFFLAFAIKVPLFPLHTWLPDAHVEAPTAGSLMLASVMLKMGTYGLVRFCVPMFPNAAHENASWINILAIVGIVYGALVAMVQPNMKKLVAYSSVSHLGFVVLGIFSFTQMGMDGAVYQMLNHGISTGALFVLVGFMNERRHSLAISDYGGVATVAPWLATVFLITTLASIGLPTLNNFVGEFLVLQGAAQANFTWTVFAALGVILSACYMLWMYQRVFFGEVGEGVKHHMPDLNMREWACMIPLAIMMVWMGMYTQTFLAPVSETDAKILSQTDMNNRAVAAASIPGSTSIPRNVHAH